MWRSHLQDVSKISKYTARWQIGHPQIWQKNYNISREKHNIWLAPCTTRFALTYPPGLFSVGFIIRKIAFCQTIFKSEINREPDPKNGAMSYGFYLYVDHYFCIENALLSVKGGKHSPVRLRSSVGLCVCVCVSVCLSAICVGYGPENSALLHNFSET